MKRKTWIAFSGGILAVAAAATYFSAKPKAEIKWRTAKVERGDIIQRISATGAVSPVVQVSVGTQVSGVISALYVDYNSIVKKGQLIAQIDPTVWKSQLMNAEAGLTRAQAAYDFAKADYERSKRLHEAKLLADQDLDTKSTALKNAKGNLVSAQAAVDQAKANLGYCNITAPVDGVVISRLADVGQTVAASFSTPSLYVIAQDLSKMKVQVSIDESDIDQVKVGEPAFFTVDSLPDKQFKARVSLVRQEPVTTSNVVTYVVEMIVPNEPLPSDHAGSFTASPGPAPDPEQAWERAKGHLPPGVTKEAFLQRFKERQASSRPVNPLPEAAPLDPKLLAHIPGGASLMPGPKFSGNLALRSGMTANVTIYTAQHKDVLRVPDAALRFNPSMYVKNNAQGASFRLGQPMMFHGRPHEGAQAGTGTKGGMVVHHQDHLWVLENGQPKPIPVTAGLSDGEYSEVSGTDLHAGLEVLVGVEGPKAAGAGPGAARGRRD